MVYYLSELGKVLLEILPGEGHHQGQKKFFPNSDDPFQIALLKQI